MRQEKDAMRRERDAALTRVAQLELKSSSQTAAYAQDRADEASSCSEVESSGSSEEESSDASDDDEKVPIDKTASSENRLKLTKTALAKRFDTRRSQPRYPFSTFIVSLCSTGHVRGVKR
jgi:hypothetical protein